jgi:hypothetical protein
VMTRATHQSGNACAESYKKTKMDGTGLYWALFYGHVLRGKYLVRLIKPNMYVLFIKKT